jgi:tetratricopeptide (TPR) repeat protein
MRTILTISLLLAVAACDKNDGAAKPAPTTEPVAPVGSSTLSGAGAAAKPASEIPATTSNPQALEAYKLGFDQYINGHVDEAREQFKKADGLDAKFVTAQVMEGAATPGTDGAKKIADAVAQAAGLPEAERVHLQLEQAFVERNTAKAVELAKKLTDVVPGAWLAHFLYGRALTGFGKREEAQVAYKKATELEPTAGLPYNDMAYNELNLGKADEAVAHFKRYVELSPKEANAQDSLGEALLMAGKYDEAEGAYKKALDMNAKFLGAWQGLALVRFYNGNWAGAYEALGKLRDAAPTIDEKALALRDTMWGQLAQGKAADAAKTLDAWDAEVTKSKDDTAGVWASLNRAGMAIETKKEADALKVLTALGDKLDKLEVSATRKLVWQVYRRELETIADARLGKKAEADKAAQALQDLVGKSDDAEMKGIVALAQGEAAIAKGDPKAAVDAFAACAIVDDYCTWERAKAQDKAGDKAGATATREKLSKTHRRDGLSFYAWSKTAPATTAAPAPTNAPAPAPTAADPKK